VQFPTKLLHQQLYPSYCDQPLLPAHSSTKMPSSSVNVLEGYTVLEDNGQQYLVPDFAVQDLKIKLDAEAKHKELSADNNTNKVGL
jgi:hypothetical protein